MRISVNGHDLEVELADNSSADALAELLRDGDLTIEMSDYNRFEKVGPLPQSLPTNDERITTAPGDVILYQGTRITIYYDSNTWSLTRLGRITNVSTAELRRILGEGDVTATLSVG